MEAKLKKAALDFADLINANKRIYDLEKIIDEVHAWAVCGCITTPEDMAQNLPRIVEITTPNINMLAGFMEAQIMKKISTQQFHVLFNSVRGVTGRQEVIGLGKDQSNVWNQGYAAAWELVYEKLVDPSLDVKAALGVDAEVKVESQTELTGVQKAINELYCNLEEKSYLKAIQIASGKLVIELVDTNIDKTYDGKVMGVTDMHVALSLGRVAVIIRQSDLDIVPAKNEEVVVKFASGLGYVELTKAKLIER